MRTLLVTGVAGFIGCNFARHALSRGYKVVGLDSFTYAGSKLNLADLRDNFELVEGDICGPEVSDILGRVNPIAVINFAAETHVDNSISNPLLFVETNVLGTANLLDRSLKFWLQNNKNPDFRFLQISTDEVFGSLGNTGKFSEKTNLDPSSPYSASKAGADHLVNAWHHTYGLPTLMTRCSNNYGPFQFPEKLIPLMIYNALAGKSLPVYGDGTNVRDWIHVEDHCRGIMLALEKGLPGESYCLGGRSEKRNIDLVKLLCAELDSIRPRKDGRSYSEQILFVKDRLGHDLRYAIDDSKSEKELGFQHIHSFEIGLRSTVEWYLRNEDWTAAILKKSSKENT